MKPQKPNPTNTNEKPDSGVLVANSGLLIESIRRHVTGVAAKLSLYPPHCELGRIGTLPLQIGQNKELAFCCCCCCFCSRTYNASDSTYYPCFWSFIRLCILGNLHCIHWPLCHTSHESTFSDFRLFATQLIFSDFHVTKCIGLVIHTLLT